MRNYNNQPIVIPVVLPPDEEKQDLNSLVLLEKIERLSQEIAEIKEATAKKKPKKPRPIKEYSEFKSDGKPKAREAESIRSYDDFLAIQNYFLERNRVRDWAFWTTGVCLGVRASDITSLKIKNVLNPDKSFRERIKIFEQKTGKLNGFLITEAIISALTRYFNTINWDFNQDSYIFASQKNKGKKPMTTQHVWRIFSDAAKALKLPINVGSHTMRRSFITIASCLREFTVDANAITIAQAHLNHSDQRTTMRYMGVLNDIKDRDRINVSDFVLGRSEINKLTDGLIREV